MADAAKKGTGKGLTKKVGPLPVWGYAAAGAGGFLIYRYLKARSAAAASTAASGTTGGTTIPNDLGLEGTQSTQASFSTVAAWETALLDYLTGNGMDPADAFTAAQAYLGGTCVSQAAYNGLASAFISPNVGLPPGFTSPPALSVCAATQQTPTPSGGSAAPSNPNPPASTASALPAINAALYPVKVLFGQYSPGDYTKIGTFTNGTYSGYNVSGGAPVYLNVDGGFVQDFDTATVNGDVYIPTSLFPYVSTTPTATPIATPPDQYKAVGTPGLSKSVVGTI